MEAASATPVGVGARNKRVTLADGPVAVSAVGAVIGIVGLFLKAFNTPAVWTLGGFHGSTTYINTTSGAKIMLASYVIGAIFLFIARGTGRKGVLWGTYIFSLIGVLFGALNAGGGFTLSGTDVKANAAVGVFVSLVGAVIMFVGAIAARRSAKPVA